MMAQTNPPQLRPFDGAKIPQTLKDQPRWAPWKAVWSEKRGKYDKIPCYPNGIGISTAKPERWMSYETALKAFTDNTKLFAGVGYVMTGPHDVVGIDLDRCVTGNIISAWAQAVIDRLGSYTELSPSGNGLRILAEGTIDADWTNHEIGIEVYAGHEPRFLTITGNRLKTSVADVLAPQADALASLSAQYAKVKNTATVISLAMPELLDALALPELSTLGLPYKTLDFLTDGPNEGDDNSRELHAAGVALYSVGLADDQVLSILAGNTHAFDIALAHRRYDHDRALIYLWVEHCQKAKGKASSKVATLDDFDDVSQAAPAGPAPALRFAFSDAATFAEAKPLEWIVKRVLPKAEVGVAYGASGSGKTFFVMDLAVAVARGVAWRGRRVKQGTVAYICAEGAGGFRLRLKAYAEHNGIDLKGLPLRVLGDSPNLMDKTDVKDLVASLKSIADLSLIVVDTWAQVTAGANENSGEDMGRALGHCKLMHKATNAMVMLVAHSGKDESRGMRGWSGVKGALDVEIALERADDYRAASISKLKDGEGEGDEYGFKLETVVLGQDADGDNITSCVVHACGTVPKAKRKSEPKGNIQQVVLGVAVDLTDLAGAITTTELVDSAVNKIPKDDRKKGDRRRDTVLRAIESLTAANRISTTGGLVTVL